MSWDRVTITITEEDLEILIHRAEQHTLRMMTAEIFSGLAQAHPRMCSKPQDRVDLVNAALAAAKLIMKGTEP